MAYHICYSNPNAWSISYEIGVYGNVGTKNDMPHVFWGKLMDLMTIKKGDLVFFYIKEEKYLTGLFEITSSPYYCENRIFDDANETYPFRFNFKEILHFENSVPSNELAKLIETGKIETIATFERDANAGFRGIRQIRLEEFESLLDLFYKYSPKTNTKNLKKFGTPKVQLSIEAVELANKVYEKVEIKLATKIKFSKLPVKKHKGIYIAYYENILQGYIYYCLRNNKNNVINDLRLNNYTECLLEVPMLKAQQFRSDILILYQLPKKPPHFYSIIETKKGKEISIEDLSQLIGYMKTYADSKNISFNSIEGVYISTSFSVETINYLTNRKSVEKENPVRLVEYSLDKKGKVFFNQKSF